MCHPLAWLKKCCNMKGNLKCVIKPYGDALSAGLTKRMLLHDGEPEMLHQTLQDMLSTGLTERISSCDSESEMLPETVRDVPSASLTERMLHQTICNAPSTSLTKRMLLRDWTWNVTQNHIWHAIRWLYHMDVVRWKKWKSDPQILHQTMRHFHWNSVVWITITFSYIQMYKRVLNMLTYINTSLRKGYCV